MSQRTAKAAASTRSSGKRKAAQDADEGVGATAKKLKSASGVTTRPRPFGPKSKVAQEDVNEDVASDGADTNKFEREHGRATTVEDYKQAIVRLRAADPNWGKVDLGPYYTEGTGAKNAKSANGTTAAAGASKEASTNVRPFGAKRKTAQDEADSTGAKKAKDANGSGMVAGTANAEAASSNVAASKPKDVGKLQFVTTARRGGPSEYEDHHEQHFREACDAFKRDDPYMLYPHDPFTDYEGYKEARRDLNDYLDGDLCCDCEDPVAETEVYKTEFDLSITSSAGEEVGKLRSMKVGAALRRQVPPKYDRSRRSQAVQHAEASRREMESGPLATQESRATEQRVRWEDIDIARTKQWIQTLALTTAQSSREGSPEAEAFEQPKSSVPMSYRESLQLEEAARTKAWLDRLMLLTGLSQPAHDEEERAVLASLDYIGAPHPDSSLQSPSSDRSSAGASTSGSDDSDYFAARGLELINLLSRRAELGSGGSPSGSAFSAD